MAGPPLAAAVAAGQRLLDAVGSTDKVGLVDVRRLGPHRDAADRERARRCRRALPTLTTHRRHRSLRRHRRRRSADRPRRTGRGGWSWCSPTATTPRRTTSLADLTAALAGDGVEVDAVGLTASGSFTAAAAAPDGGGDARHATCRRRSSPRSSRSRPGWPQTGWPASWAVDVALPHSSSRRSRAACTAGRRRTCRCRPAWPGRRCLCGASTGPGSWRCSGSPPSDARDLVMPARPSAGRRRSRRGSRPYSSELSTGGGEGARAGPARTCTRGSRRGSARRGRGDGCDMLAERAGSTVPTGQIVTIIAATRAVPGRLRAGHRGAAAGAAAAPVRCAARDGAALPAPGAARPPSRPSCRSC